MLIFLRYEQMLLGFHSHNLASLPILNTKSMILAFWMNPSLSWKTSVV